MNYVSARVQLFTRRAEYDRKDRILEQVREYLKSAGLPVEWGRKDQRETVAENDVDRQETIDARFFVEQCVDELSVSKCVREQRVVVDMRKSPRLYLQIMAVSAGIPQITIRETQFVEHGKNGQVLQDMSQLADALGFYLDGLSNWNDAMVHSYELGRRYSSEALINQWKEVIGSLG